MLLIAIKLAYNICIEESKIKNLTFSSKRLILIIPALLILLSVIWIPFNLTKEPVYGDTPEYWGLAKTLKVDSWRTVGYPLVLKVDRHFLNVNPAHAALYIFQTAVMFFAIYYFYSAMQARHPDKKRTIMLSMFTLSLPLVMHFNFSVLTDSLATSTLLISCTAIYKLILSKDADLRSLAMAVCGLIASGFLRLDRLLDLAVFVGLTSLWAIIKRQRWLLLGCVLLIFCVGATEKINKYTQTADLGRPKLSVNFMLFDRTARTRLPELMPYMPLAIKQRITPQMARTWQQHANEAASIAIVLQDEAGQKALVEGSKVALKHNFFGIAEDMTIDFLKFLIAPVVYIKESVIQQNTGTAYFTYWTNSRFNLTHSRLSSIYQSYSIILMSFLVVFTIIKFPCWWRLQGHPRRMMVAYWSVVVVLLAFINVLPSSLGFHVRYALPIYIIEMCMFTLVFSELKFGVAVKKIDHRRATSRVIEGR